MPFRSVILLGAFLLFAVQPLVGRAVLPLFGGSAGVWLACLLFFQIMLLAGYGYVHRLLARLPIRKQLRVQGLFLALALLSFGLGWMRGGAPLLPSEGMAGTTLEPPSLAILLVLAQTCAFPFLLLSSTSPLVQSWYARVHPERDPYPLYALSNLGNVAGLLAFPLLAEPFLSLRVVAWIFGALYLAYGALFLFLHLGAARALPDEEPSAAAVEETTEPDRRGAWVALSALGTIWLLAGSNHLSRDLAALPMLWMPPLLAYLLSFILAFGGRFDLTGRAMLVAALLGQGLFAVVFGAAPLVRGLGNALASMDPVRAEKLLDRDYGLRFGETVTARILQYLGRAPQDIERITDLLFLFEHFLVPVLAVFLACCVLHGALARLRPQPARLTRFYFFVALGGALGGLLGSVVAPLVFRDEFELPLAVLATSALCLWKLRGAARALPIGSWALAGAAAVLWLTVFGGDHDHRWPLAVSVLSALGLWKLHGGAHAVRIGTWVLGGATAVLCLATLGDGTLDPDSKRARDFFGTAQVRKPSPALLQLVDGKTLHGQQLVQYPLQPIGYFGEQSGIGIALRAMQARRPALRIGIVGLGAGSVAGYARPTDEVVYFEISPKIIALAGHHGSAFQVIDSSPAKIEIRQGDGRLLLKQELATRRGGFDLLMIDAFAGGAIPAHLLTVEALRTYLDNVAEDGLLVLHVSHHLPLCNQVGATLRTLGLPAKLYQRADEMIGTDENGKDIVLEFTNQYMVTAHSAGPLNLLPLPPNGAIYRPEGPRPTWGPEERAQYDAFLRITDPFTAWTDDRHSLAPLLWRYMKDKVRELRNSGKT